MYFSEQSDHRLEFPETWFYLCSVSRFLFSEQIGIPLNTALLVLRKFIISN